MDRFKRLGAVSCGIVLAAALLLSGGVANAWMIANGCVYCDANGNQVIDPVDTPLVGVTVDVDRDISYEGMGTFNSAVTGADGCYEIPLWWPASAWTETLDASTLPADASFVDPNTNSHLFTIVQDPSYLLDTRNWLIGSASCRVPICGDGILDSGEVCDDGNNDAGDGCSSTCTTEQVGDGQGCTPGYWKQAQHFDSWVFYTPSTMFSAVFDNAFPGKTLLQVLKQGGGGLNALGRHAVAAILNAQNPGMQYGLTAPEVIGLFNEAFPGVDGGYNTAKSVLESNNELICPLN